MMIDEKKLLDKLQQWHYDAEKMKELAVSDDDCGFIYE